MNLRYYFRSETAISLSHLGNTMKRKQSACLLAGVSSLVLAGFAILPAQAATTNDYQLVGGYPVSGNDCTGGLGTDPNCSWDGSPQIIKIDFHDSSTDVSAVSVNPMFADVTASMFAFSFDTSFANPFFSWTYTPCPTCPGITAFSVKFGNYYSVYEKQGQAFAGLGDFSDDWLTGLNPASNAYLAPSHITFFDTTTQIPLPAAGWLMLGALGALVGLKRRRRQPA